jgi:8-oxo-dGTP pyrophosphatase MutT (NUDIX family)
MKRHTRYQAAIIKDDHILLVKNQNMRTGEAYWLIPGGGIEPGETDIECICREAREETGLEVAVDRLLFEVASLPGGMYKYLRTYLCKRVSGEVEAGYEPEAEFTVNIIDIRWFDLRAPETWEDQIIQSPFLYPLLVKLRQVLGYTNGSEASQV